MLPRVVIHNEISLDGRIDWLDVDMGRFYRLAGTWREDATLVGCDTIVEALPELAIAGDEVEPEAARESVAATLPPDDGKPAPLLVVTDSRGRLPGLHRARSQPYWRDVIALCSGATPAAHLDRLRRCGIDHNVSGNEKPDLRAALEWLAERHGVRLVRVDSGGTLGGALLRAGLVAEVSMLVEPRLVGGTSVKAVFRAPDAVVDDDVVRLRLTTVERLPDGVVWLRYDVEPHVQV